MPQPPVKAHTKSQNSGNPFRKTKSGQTHMRSKAKIQHLNMINGGHAIRDKNGKIVGGSLVRSDTAGGKEFKPGQMAHIAPNRKWFGNTRIISQNELDSLREKVTVQNNDPYSFVLRRKKIPMSLLQQDEGSNKVAKVNLLENESFDEVFSKSGARKRPKLDDSISDYASLMNRVTNLHKNMSEINQYDGDQEQGAFSEDAKEAALIKEDLFTKGQSKRIWSELYKVLDSSDVVIQVIDARNVPGTRSYHVEKYLKKNASHKQMIVVINKCDLVPTWVTRKWVKIISKDYPCVAFHASMNNAFGKGALISLLRQYSKLHSDKRQISVGIIGYPNVGKSSIINTLKGDKCCKTAPIPGETKIWQYVTLTKRIYLIDCPGIVYDGANDSEADTVLKGVVRSERLSAPTDFIIPILKRVGNIDYIKRLYGVALPEVPEHLIKGEDKNKKTQNPWSLVSDNDMIEVADEFVLKLSRAKGKLLANGEPDANTVAKMMINDWQRGKIPYFVPPPFDQVDDEDEEEIDDNDINLGSDREQEDEAEVNVESVNKEVNGLDDDEEDEDQ